MYLRSIIFNKKIFIYFSIFVFRAEKSCDFKMSVLLNNKLLIEYVKKGDIESKFELTVDILILLYRCRPDNNKYCLFLRWVPKKYVLCIVYYKRMVM